MRTVEQYRIEFFSAAEEFVPGIRTWLSDEFADAGYGVASPREMARRIGEIQQYMREIPSSDILRLRDVVRSFFRRVPVDVVAAGVAFTPRVPSSRPGRKAIRRLRRVADGQRCLHGMYNGNHVDTDARERTSRSAAALLSRMPVWAQVAALDRPIQAGGFIRPRDLDWDAVERVRRDIAADPTGRVLAAWSVSSSDGIYAVVRRASGCRDHQSMAEWLSPSYPHVMLEDAVLLARGVSPVELLRRQGADVTAAEAHRILSNVETARMVARHAAVNVIVDGLPLTSNSRDIAVARWLRAVWDRGDWNVLERRARRRPGAPDERMVDRLDEVDRHDLVRGSATGVRAVFDRVEQRWVAAQTAAALQDERVIATIPDGWRLPRCARFLTTRAALSREGREMEHCVGGYASMVEDGRCVIVALDVRGHRATAELSTHGAVVQLKGPRNQEPHELCRRAAAVISRRLARGSSPVRNGG